MHLVMSVLIHMLPVLVSLLRSGLLGVKMQAATVFSKCPYRRWERVNTVISYICSVIWFIWIVSAYKVLLHVAPCLVWLTLAFLAIDMFFAAISILLSFLVGLAVCFCFPCIIGIMYFVARKKDGPYGNKWSRL
nr:stromal processing peptidase, chloroplastic-like [Tanacetum cinerariifolium]